MLDIGTVCAIPCILGHDVLEVYMEDSSKDVNSVEYWDKILADEGLKVIGDNDRPKRQIPLAKSHAKDDLLVSQENSNTVKETVEYFTMLKHYCEQNRFKFPEFAHLSLRQRSYIKILLLLYCDGYTVAQGHKYLKRQLRLKNIERANSLIFYFKKVQIIKEKFLKDFYVFSKYMMYIKYSYTANPKSWLEFKELETFLPGYHDEHY